MPSTRIREVRNQKNVTLEQLAERTGYSVSYLSRLEKDGRNVSLKLLRAIAGGLAVEQNELLPSRSELVPIIGKVGADPEGRVLFSHGQGTGDFAAMQPGGGENVVALEVDGHSMRGIADNGALIYFEQQETPPTSDMLGEVVIVEVESGEVLVKRLLRGSTRGRYDLESVAGPTREDAKVKWAAHITAIIPPHRARQIIVRDIAI